MKRQSPFFKKAIILTTSNILTGAMNFIFSLLLSREIGSSGMGLYQLVMPLYNMFLFITGGGITVTLSKVAAEKKASSNLCELYKTVKCVILFELIWSSIITCFVLVAAGFLSTDILSDKRTMYSIFAFCPALIIISISSVFKGTYYGLQKVGVPAAIDIVEKVVRISIMYPLILLTRNAGIEFCSAAAVFSLSCGELASCTLFYICYKRYKRRNIGYGRSDNCPQLVLNVLKLSIPLAMNGILGTLFSTLNTVLIPKRLSASGLSYEQGLSLLGKLQGMAMNIALFPTVITGAVNTLIIPTISEAVTYNKPVIINHRINTAFRVGAVTGFSSCAIVLAIPELLGSYFFKDPAVGALLRLLAPGLPFIYLEITTFVVLNGLGKQGRLLINSTALSLWDLTLIYVLLSIPALGIKGYGFIFLTSSLVGIVINYIPIRKSIGFKPDIFGCLILPMLSAVPVYILCRQVSSSSIQIPLLILLCFGLYFGIYVPLYIIWKRK
jgi:stage V sporulation protein B